MELNERLKKIDKFFNNLSDKDFERMAFESGIGEIGDTPKLELDDEVIDTIIDRKNHPIEDFKTGYIVNSLTSEELNRILKDPNCGIILCTSKVPYPILDFLELLRIVVYHNISEEEIKLLKDKFSSEECSDESIGGTGKLSKTNSLE